MLGVARLVGSRGSRLLLIGALALTCCASPPPSSDAAVTTVPPTASATAVPSGAAARAEEELGVLLRTLEGTHPDPFHGIQRSAFVRALDGYAARLPDLEPEEAAVELMRVWALLSREGGRDGHQFVLPAATVDDSMLPLRVYEFEEGVFITDALDGDADLVGARILAIGGHDIDDVLADVEPLVPRDGPATVHAHRPILLLRTVVLRGLGIIGDGPVEVRVVDRHGDEREVALDPVERQRYENWAGPFGRFRLPTGTQNRYLAGDEAFDVERIDEAATLYVRYRFVSSPATDRAVELVAEGGIERLVLDLRQNPGGDNNTYDRLLDFVQEWAGEHPGTTFVLTDRVTFSAASNLATRIEATTDAVFVGEAMGGSPNLWADVNWVTLRHLPIPMRAAVSTTYWEMSGPDDPRLTIPPDVPVAVTAVDHFAHRDPSLAAALAAPLGGGSEG